MNVVVDRDKCCASGQCARVAPEVFDQSEDDGTVILLAAEPAEGQYAAVRQAAHLCPATAITLQD